jgi:hypothetical protein
MNEEDGRRGRKMRRGGDGWEKGRIDLKKMGEMGNIGKEEGEGKRRG